MYKLIYSTAFEKQLRQLKKQGKIRELNKLPEILKLLQNGIFLPPQYRDHKLHNGKYRCFHIAFDMVVLYTYDGDVIYLYQIGDHHSIKGFKESLNEKMEKHETLNPKLWSNDELIPKVKSKLEDIVDKFVETLKDDEVNLKVLDVLLVGSNVSYNYSETSDLDVHIVADTQNIKNSNSLLQILYNAYKTMFNNKYDITIKGIEVELYVEDMRTSANSNGIYSLSKGWIKKPVAQDIPDVDIDDVFKEYEYRYKQTIDSKSLKDVDSLIDDLYLLRKHSIMADGEYGVGNLVFKEFRSLNYLDTLKELKIDLESEELSIKESIQ